MGLWVIWEETSKVKAKSSGWGEGEVGNYDEGGQSVRGELMSREGVHFPSPPAHCPCPLLPNTVPGCTCVCWFFLGVPCVCVCGHVSSMCLSRFMGACLSCVHGCLWVCLGRPVGVCPVSVGVFTLGLGASRGGWDSATWVLDRLGLLSMELGPGSGWRGVTAGNSQV